MVHAAVERLQQIQALSKHGEYYAEKLTGKLAKAYYDGDHKPTFRTLKDGEEYTATEKNAHSIAPHGVSVAGGIDDFAECGHAWRHLANDDLSNAPSEEEVRQIYNAYDVVSNDRN
jgi:hypothetical protein